MRALSKLIYVNSPDLVLFVGESLVGNDAVDQLSKFNQKLAELSPSPIPRLIDGILLTKFDTIDDKMVPRGPMYRGPARNIADANMAAGVGSGMLPVPYGMACVGGMLPLDATASIPQPMPITALASALANASPDQQRTTISLAHCSPGLHACMLQLGQNWTLEPETLLKSNWKCLRMGVNCPYIRVL
ncbi:polyadenylate-binding protein 8 [Helianthus annuus]|uniref:polyadenylate-binding protein 8 n=1 Tax=Helianthus annuus TaxID=4232 RepID=UPI000B900B31|nr:polyadenylate-binding protein 8 [Helianthus annuus]